MNNADYQIVLLDPATGATLDIIPQDRWRRLQYRRVLNAIGNVVLTLPADDRAVDIVKNTEDVFLEIYRRNVTGGMLEREETFIIRHRNPFSDENGIDWYIVGGLSLNVLLKQRIIDIQDDPNTAGGYLSYFDAAATVMQNLVKYQCEDPQTDTARAYPNFSVSSNTSGNDVFFREPFAVNLLDALRDLEPEGRVDFRVERDVSFTAGIGLQFIAVRQGNDRTVTTNYPGSPSVLFSEERGKIREPNFDIDARDEINAVYVMGQGPENDREILLVQNAARIAASPYARKESTTDARNTDDTDGLTTSGEAVLEEKRVKKSFNFTPDIQADGLQYNIDWVLGDDVTARYKGISEDFRIIAAVVSTDGTTDNVEIELENENV